MMFDATEKIWKCMTCGDEVLDSEVVDHRLHKNRSCKIMAGLAKTKGILFTAEEALAFMLTLDQEAS